MALMQRECPVWLVCCVACLTCQWYKSEKNNHITALFICFKICFFVLYVVSYWRYSLVWFQWQVFRGYDAVSTFVIQRDQQNVCRLFPLISCQYRTSISDVINLLLSMARFIAAEWQYCLMHLQHVQSVDFYPFSSYMKGNRAVF